MNIDASRNWYARRIRHRLNLYVAGSMAARSVASAARARQSNRDQALAEAARHLAAAAEALAGRDDADAVDDAADRALTTARGRLETAGDRVGGADAGELHPNPLQRPLERMLLALQHLTDRYEAAPTTPEAITRQRTVSTG